MVTALAIDVHPVSTVDDCDDAVDIHFRVVTAKVSFKVIHG
jgi:hypothetical protein